MKSASFEIHWTSPQAPSTYCFHSIHQHYSTTASGLLLEVVIGYHQGLHLLPRYFLCPNFRESRLVSQFSLPTHRLN
jgi:hypothetical protein